MSKVWERFFPNLQPSDWREASPATEEYNCIAYAAGDTSKWWWPDAMGQRYWPNRVPRWVHIDNFIRAFETVRYEKCDDGSVEAGYEKIVIYTNAQGLPRHAARQVANGEWVSKIGKSEDIEHVTPDVLICIAYGRPFQFMRRPT